MAHMTTNEQGRIFKYSELKNKFQIEIWVLVLVICNLVNRNLLGLDLGRPGGVSFGADRILSSNSNSWLNEIAINNRHSGT